MLFRSTFQSPALPLSGSVLEQVVVRDGMTSTCFQSTAGTPSKNDASAFGALGNP